MPSPSHLTCELWSLNIKKSQDKKFSKFSNFSFSNLFFKNRRNWKFSCRKIFKRQLARVNFIEVDRHILINRILTIISNVSMALPLTRFSIILTHLQSKILKDCFHVENSYRVRPLLIRVAQGTVTFDNNNFYRAL